MKWLSPGLGHESRSSVFYLPDLEIVHRLEDGQRCVQGPFWPEGNPEGLLKLVGVVKADSKTDAEWPQVLGTVPATTWIWLSLVTPLQSGMRPLKENESREFGTTQKDEREGEENQPWRAVPWKGQRKEKASGGSRNDQLAKQGGVKGTGKVVSSSPNFLPHSCSFSWFSSFLPLSAPPFPKLHFYSEESFPFADKWHSFLGS